MVTEDSNPSKVPAAGEPSSGQNQNQHHFETTHLLANVKERTISSGFITALSQLVQMTFNLASVIVLARLLTPRDFGLVAMVATITGFLRIFNEAGLSTATVQREGITHAQVSNLFWTNVALGGVASLVLAISAPAIAWFYREPRLVGITLAMCIIFLLTGSSVQHMALLKRQMRFKMIAAIQISAVVAGVVVGIGMAWLNCGYWSLVGMQLSMPAVAFLLTWSASRWRPQWPARRSGTRAMLGFGANLTASSFIWSLARGSDSLFIGRLYGSVSLGLYSRAYSLLIRPVDQFMGPLEAVLVPTLSRLVPQPERYRRVFLQVYEIKIVCSFLFTGLLLAAAYPLTLVVLGPKWEKAAPIFSGFALVALFTPVGSVASWLLASQGRGSDYLRLSLIGSLVTIASFLAGLPFGPAGVAIAYSAFCLLISLPLVNYIAGRCGPVTTRDLWTRFFTHLPVWCVVTGTTWLSRVMVMNFDPWIQLIICVPAGLLGGCVFISLHTPSRHVALGLFRSLRKSANSLCPF